MYATKAEVAKVASDHKDEVKRIETRFSQWMEQQRTQHQENMDKTEEVISKFTDWQLTIERALGHVETKADISLGKARK